MPEFSLIVATKGRTNELARLIASIEAQTDADYELIIVDQNEDDRLASVIQHSTQHAKILCLRCETGVSRARNLGIESARGKIIAFPDDDCWYPPGILRAVSSWFDAHLSYEILCLNSLATDGTRSGNRWIQDSCDLNLFNVYRTSVGYAYFIRSQGVAQAVRYDEGIGPGANTPYLGGEDSDFILAAMETGARGRFEAKWHIGHPVKDIRNASVQRDRVYVYGKGMGFVQKKHRLAWLWTLFVALDYVRAACAFLVGKRKPAELWYWHGRGLINGFFAIEANPLPQSGQSVSS